MQNVFAPLMNMYQTQLDMSRKCADAVFSGAEQMDRVVIGATHRAFTDQMNFVQALASVRDPRTVGDTLQSSFMRRSPDDAMNYQKEMMRIFADMQNEIGRSLQDYVQQFGSHAAVAAEKPMPPEQGQAVEAVFNPMTSMFSVWESAFKDVAALAKKNMTAARSTVDNTASSTRQAAGNYADVMHGSTAGAAGSAVSGATSDGKSTMVIVDGAAGTEDKKGISSSPAGGNKRK